MQPRPVAIAAAQGLDTWFDKLVEPNLPLLPGTRESVIHQLHHPGASADSVARAISCDPALCLRLVTRCNRLLAKSETQVHQLPHIVSLLGFPALEQSIRSAPVLKGPNPGYLAAIARSQFAAALAAMLLQQSHSANGDDIYLAALFFNSPYWALWHRAEQTMARLDGLCAGGMGRSRAEVLLFGGPLNRLALRLIQQWPLPAMTAAAWQFNLPDKASFLARLHRLTAAGLARWQDTCRDVPRLLAMPELTLALVNNLAESSHWDWHSRRTRRWSTLLERQRPSLGHTIEGRIHRLAGQLSLAPAIPAHCHPGRRLLCNWREAEWVTPLRPAAAEAAATADRDSDEATTAPGTPPPAFANRVLLAANLRRFSKRGQSFANLHQLMHLAVETLCDGAGFQRALIMMLNGQRSQLRSYYQRGFDAGDPIVKLALQVPSQTRGLFAKLLEKSCGLRVTPERSAKLRPQLPEAFNRACTAEQFALASVFHQRLPVAIIYVDGGALGEAQYRLLRQIGEGVGRAVTEFARAKRLR